MIDLFTSLLSQAGGLLLFGAAYYLHQKQRLTRVACIIAAVAGFLTYGAWFGVMANQIAMQIQIGLVAAVIVGIGVIVADIKGKRRGADRPALFAFFLVPIFLSAFFVSLPPVVEQVGENMQQVGENVTSQMGQ